MVWFETLTTKLKNSVAPIVDRVEDEVQGHDAVRLVTKLMGPIAVRAIVGGRAARLQVVSREMAKGANVMLGAFVSTAGDVPFELDVAPKPLLRKEASSCL